MSELDFGGKTVLVVGGSGGIGNAIARAFRDKGACVHVTGTRPQPADYEGRAGAFDGFTYHQLEFKDGADVAAAPSFEELDVLVLAHGTILYARREFDPPTFSSVVDVNLTSMLSLATRYRSALSQAKGAMIVVSSVGGIRITRANPAYAASKAGLIHLTRTLGDAWASEGIRVNGIAPGLIETDMIKVTTEHPERLRKRLEGIPLRRIGQPSEVASIALFLASPMASYIIGHTIVADGGRTLA